MVLVLEKWWMAHICNAMALFVVIPDGPTTASLDAKVREKFGNGALQLPRGEWLISYDGTAKQLSDDLQITDGSIGVGAAVLGFSGYWGRTSKAVWQWISTQEAKP